MTEPICQATRARRIAAAIALGIAASGCSVLPRYTYTNTPDRASADTTDRPAPTTPAAAPAPLRASLDIDGQRGNPKALVFLALSGGGSRSAYFAGQVMLKLQTVLPDLDLLAEVDVMSAVSGGSLPAAYYALTRDASVRLPSAARQLAPSLDGTGPLAALKADLAAGTIACSAPLGESAATDLRALLGTDERAASVVTHLCAQADRKDRRVWRDDTVRDLMRRNYLARLLGNMLWPANVLRYWFTDFDRADIMAQTFADNLLDTPVIGSDLTLGDIDASRPYLVLNATNATEQPTAGGKPLDDMPFGSVFTFTDDDFRAQLGSQVRTYSAARAVMASSAFPVVFPAMTLCDFRSEWSARRNDCKGNAYLHVFDGGNADNLGLKAIKRMLLQLHAADRLKDYDRVVVMLVDAFATPIGTSRQARDPRDWLDFFVDTNVVDAVDSLLRTNRLNLLKEFDNGQLEWHQADCEDATRELPQPLCDALAAKKRNRSLPLQDRLVFYHIGFDDVKGDPDLLRRLNRISTSFAISKRNVAHLDAAVDNVMTRDNPCLVAIGQLVQRDALAPQQISEARAVCQRTDVLPRESPTATDAVAR